MPALCSVLWTPLSLGLVDLTFSLGRICNSDVMGAFILLKSSVNSLADTPRMELAKTPHTVTVSFDHHQASCHVFPLWEEHISQV